MIARRICSMTVTKVVSKGGLSPGYDQEWSAQVLRRSLCGMQDLFSDSYVVGERVG